MNFSFSGIKTAVNLIVKNQKKIVHAVKSLHSYSVPCVIFFDIKNGNKDFLKWVKQSVI